MEKVVLPEIIETKNLILKKFSLDTAEQYLELINKNSYEWGLYSDSSFYKKEYSLEEIKEDIKNYFLNDFNYAIFYKENMIGEISIDPISYSTDSCKLGFALDKDAQGKGLMTEVLKSIEELLKPKGFNRVVLRINTLNRKSIDFAERNHYIREGIAKSSAKHLIDIENGRKYSDMIIYSKLLKEDR